MSQNLSDKACLVLMLQFIFLSSGYYFGEILILILFCRATLGYLGV